MDKPAVATLRAIPIKVTLLYVGVGVLWILGSDAVLFALVGGGPESHWYNSAKGVLFVAVTGGGLYLLLRYYVHLAILGMLRAEHTERDTQRLLGRLPIGVVHVDVAGKVLYCNKAYLQLYRRTGQRLRDRSVYDLAGSAEEADGIKARLQDASQGVERSRRELIQTRRADGSPLEVQLDWEYLRDEREAIVSLVAAHLDVTELHRVRRALEHSRNQYRTLVENANEGVSVIQGDYPRYANPKLLEMLGYAYETFLGTPWRDFVHPDDMEDVEVRFQRRAVGEPAASPYHFRVIDRGGKVRWMEAKAAAVEWESAPAVLTFLTDITTRVEAEAHIEFLAQHDELTGLPNRSLFLDRANQAIAHARRAHRAVAVLYLDLNRFQRINDSHGHEVGDLLIRQVAERLAAGLRDDDSVARISGDEFGILLADLGDVDDVPAIVAQIMDGLSRPLAAVGQEMFITASVGIAAYPQDGFEAEELLRNAATAMDQARGSGRNRYSFFAEELNARAAEQLELETALRHAIDRDELELFYQPQADLKTGEIVAAEALLRWRRPGYGVVPPLKFISLLEETALIVPVGEWVLQEACRAQRRWLAQTGRDLRVCVNLSARQLMDAGAAHAVAMALADTGITPTQLEMEITESCLVTDPERAARILEDISGRGVRIAVDDFGIGYSALSYFRRFAVDCLKVDKSFVQDSVSDAQTGELVKAIVAMGHSLHLDVVAEGVETAGQLGLVRGLGCNRLQGYYLSRPLEEEAFLRFLREGRVLELSQAPSGTEPQIVLLAGASRDKERLERVIRSAGYRAKTVASAGEAFEQLATQAVAAVVAAGALEDLGPREFLRRVESLYPGPCRLLFSEAAEQEAPAAPLSSAWTDDELIAALQAIFQSAAEGASVGGQYGGK